MHFFRLAALLAIASTASAVATPSLVERQDLRPGQAWPLYGLFNGTEGEAENSCGDSRFNYAGLYRENCEAALAKWNSQWYWDPKWGRQSQVASQCVLVWHPTPNLAASIEASQLQTAFTQLFDACPEYEGLPNLWNYAYHKIDDTPLIWWWGTVSLYWEHEKPDA